MRTAKETRELQEKLHEHINYVERKIDELIKVTPDVTCLTIYIENRNHVALLRSLGYKVETAESNKPNEILRNFYKISW